MLSSVGADVVGGEGEIDSLETTEGVGTVVLTARAGALASSCARLIGNSKRPREMMSKLAFFVFITSENSR
jgi:hypothetical protein